MDREAGIFPGLTPRIDVLGVKVSAIDMEMATQVLHTWIENDAREYVCVTGVHGIMESQNDPALLEIHNRAGLITPDGMPLVWCGRYAGAAWIDRVYGPDLMLRLCAASLDHGWSHYFYGAAPGVADELGNRLSGRFPGLKVVGTHSPPFRDLSDGELESYARTLNDAGPDIVWVGLSTPKQERWMARMRPLLDASVLVGVGAAFDIHAGRVPQAPRWIQRSGLEWLFRVSVEPKRLWRRYFESNPRFLKAIAKRPPTLT